MMVVVRMKMMLNCSTTHLCIWQAALPWGWSKRASCWSLTFIVIFGLWTVLQVIMFQLSKKCSLCLKSVKKCFASVIMSRQIKTHFVKKKKGVGAVLAHNCTIFLCSLNVGNIVQGGIPLYASVKNYWVKPNRLKSAQYILKTLRVNFPGCFWGENHTKQILRLCQIFKRYILQKMG